MKRWYLYIVLLLVSNIGFGQTNLITGKVTDAATGEPLIGANVFIKGSLKGTVTDLDGNYSIAAEAEDILVFSFIGYVKKEVVVGNQTTIDIALDEDTETLEEVVVIGYGKIKKSDLTGSVSSIKSEDIAKIPSLNPEQALQGKMAGVRVTSSSGEPGAAPTVRVRGVGTFGNPDPIFVVDGVILDDITFLNSADIASIEVLKDASATAMYGSRGANGVIMVTTKSADHGDAFTFNFTANYELQTIQHYIDMLNAREFATAINKIQPGTFNNLNLLENTDWQQEVYQDYAPINNYQFSASGGTEKNRFYGSVGYFDQEGIVPGSNYERLTIRLNNDYLVHQNIRIGHNLTISSFTQDRVPDIVASTLRAWPTDPPKNPDGSFYGNRGNGNPLASLYYNNSVREGLRSVGNFYGEVTFLKNFVFRSSFGIDYEDAEEQSFTPVFFVTAQQQNEESQLNKSKSSVRNWLWENTLNYHIENDLHSVDLLAGYTSQEDNFESLGGSSKNLLRDDIRYFNNEQTDFRLSNNAGIRSYISYLGRANYVFLDKYLFTATFRRDISSAFGENYRDGNFPSFAAGWRLSEENFFTIDIISNLKLRASWGIVGNDKVDVTKRYTLVTSNWGAVFGQNEMFYPGATYDQSGNPRLRWEEAKSTDIGMELGMFGNKLALEFDYYYKITEDIIISLEQPGYMGNGTFSPVYFNAAQVLNSGIEYVLTWRDNVGDFFYEFTTTGTTIHNEVLQISEDTGAEDSFTTGSLGNGQSVKRYEVGQPLGYFYGYKVDGVFQNEEELAMYPSLPNTRVGDFRFANVHQDTVLNEKDRTYLGSSIPDFFFGLSLSGSYKGFSLSMDFQGEFGSEIYDGKDAVRAGQYNFQQHIAEAWSGEGSTNSQPRVTASGVNYSQSDWFVYDGSFFRLRNVTLGYNLSPAVLEKIYLKKATLFIRGTNVFTLTEYPGYTPEIGGDVEFNGIDRGVYPITSVYGGGINITF